MVRVKYLKFFTLDFIIKESNRIKLSKIYLFVFILKRNLPTINSSLCLDKTIFLFLLYVFSHFSSLSFLLDIKKTFVYRMEENYIKIV